MRDSDFGDEVALFSSGVTLEGKNPTREPRCNNPGAGQSGVNRHGREKRRRWNIAGAVKPAVSGRFAHDALKGRETLGESL